MKDFCLLVFLAIAATTVALSQNTDPAKAAFERIKDLEGSWEGHSERGGDSTLIYRVIGRGSAIVEEYSDSDGDKMETVYYLEGGDLLLRHYCVAKNQPRMKASKIDLKNGKINFDFVDGINIGPGDGHMHQIWLEVTNLNTLRTGATYYKEDKPLFSESVQYKRRSTP